MAPPEEEREEEDPQRNLQATKVHDSHLFVSCPSTFVFFFLFCHTCADLSFFSLHSFLPPTQEHRKGKKPNAAPARGLTSQIVEGMCKEFCIETNRETLVSRLSESLHERKTDLIGKLKLLWSVVYLLVLQVALQLTLVLNLGRVLDTIGLERTLALFRETMRVEREGGMTVSLKINKQNTHTEQRQDQEQNHLALSQEAEKQNYERRRTTGGIFLYLLKTHSTDEERKRIYNEQTKTKKTQKKKRKRGRERKRNILAKEEQDNEGTFSSETSILSLQFLISKAFAEGEGNYFMSLDEKVENAKKRLVCKDTLEQQLTDHGFGYSHTMLEKEEQEDRMDLVEQE